MLTGLQVHLYVSVLSDGWTWQKYKNQIFENYSVTLYENVSVMPVGVTEVKYAGN
jgi:hypothetical protein